MKRKIISTLFIIIHTKQPRNNIKIQTKYKILWTKLMKKYRRPFWKRHCKTFLLRYIKEDKRKYDF